MRSTTLQSQPSSDWLAEYKASKAQLLNANPEFAAWLETEYVPIAGGWQY